MAKKAKPGAGSSFVKSARETPEPKPEKQKFKIKGGAPEEVQPVLEMLRRGILPQRTPVPDFYGSTIQAFASPVDVTLVLSRQVPGTIGDKTVGLAEPVVALHLSPGTAKDLSILLTGLVESHEKEWGEIQTEFTRRLAAEKAATRQ